MWPKEVQANREILAGGVVIYHLRHVRAGTLGRILLQPAGTDGCQVTWEVIDLADGRFEERQQILEPLGRMVAAALGGAAGRPRT